MGGDGVELNLPPMHIIHNTAAMTYSDVSGLLGASAAVLTLLWGIAIWFASRIVRKRTDEIISATTGAIQKFIAGQMDALIAHRDPKSYYTLDLVFPGGTGLFASHGSGPCDLCV